jgi:hypothetical protein
MATATVTVPPPVETPNDAPLMEFAVDRGQFLTEVAAAARVPDGRSTQPFCHTCYCGQLAEGCSALPAAISKEP